MMIGTLSASFPLFLLIIPVPNAFSNNTITLLTFRNVERLRAHVRLRLHLLNENRAKR